MAIDNDLNDCDRCLGGGQLEVCPLCGSDDIENTGPDGCEHELPSDQAWYSTIDCPDCDGTGNEDSEDAE